MWELNIQEKVEQVFVQIQWYWILMSRSSYKIKELVECYSKMITNQLEQHNKVSCWEKCSYVHLT